VKEVPAPQVVASVQGSEMPLPAQIQEALGEPVGAASEGSFGLERRSRAACGA
jgi:hypothetical protein